MHACAFVFYVCVHHFIIQMKRCGEMARKLCFIREEMSKAGLFPSTQSTGSVDIDFASLEVSLDSSLLICKAFDASY